MLPEDSPAKHIHRKLSSHIPSFSDIFDEESFYIFAALITLGSIVAAVIASRYVTVKDAGHID